MITVETVICKECERAQIKDKRGIYLCMYDGLPKDESDFCSYGIPREETKNETETI